MSSLKLTNPGSVAYPKKFHPGDIAISRVDIEFVDGSKHSRGQRILVNENNISYFNVNHEDYDLG